MDLKKLFAPSIVTFSMLIAYIYWDKIIGFMSSFLTTIKDDTGLAALIIFFLGWILKVLNEKWNKHNVIVSEKKLILNWIFFLRASINMQIESNKRLVQDIAKDDGRDINNWVRVPLYTTELNEFRLKDSFNLLVINSNFEAELELSQNEILFSLFDMFNLLRINQIEMDNCVNQFYKKRRIKYDSIDGYIGTTFMDMADFYDKSIPTKENFKYLKRLKDVIDNVVRSKSISFTWHEENHFRPLFNLMVDWRKNERINEVLLGKSKNVLDQIMYTNQLNHNLEQRLFGINNKLQVIIDKLGEYHDSIEKNSKVKYWLLIE